jgi:inorganic phosphate transporter, PiT family
MIGGISISLIVVIILALTFEFINGFHDTANAIATTVSTRVLTPSLAIALTCSMNFLGALAGDKVAKTISGGLIHGEIAQYVIMAALLAAIIWNLITWYLGLPSSSSHALIGGLIGSSMVYAMSFQKVIWTDGLSGGLVGKVLIPLVASPVVGFIVGLALMSLLYKLFAAVSLQIVNKLFAKLQVVSAALMAFSHGNNDAQKTMGIITLALVNAGFLNSDAGIPWEVKIVCAVAIAAGTSVGGWRIIKTMGSGLTKLQTISGFAAQTSAAIVIQAASAIGAPVSTTQVISTAIMGVGTAKRASAVKWFLAIDIAKAWGLTIPITAIMGALITMVFKLFI